MSGETPVSQPEVAEVAEVERGAAPAVAPTARRAPRRPSRIWRRTTLARAMGEGVVIYLAGRLLAMVAPGVFPAALFPAVLVLRLALLFCPPVWAALRVTSTRREKMSRRFWWLGPRLALACVVVDSVVALALGDALLLGGAAGPADAWRLTHAGAQHLTLGAFLWGQVALLVTLTIYFTIAVVCTRLANGGFLRFTMPAGNGRVTL
ncbi:MAG TPA: hypothetical protein VGR57_18670 [Ktedonobacterales bacterium]|nr:hypothetical protein [Ktedonobacterales bacterium]